MTNQISINHTIHAGTTLFGSQAKLARALGVTRSTISNWKKRGVPKHRAEQLAEIIETQPAGE